MRISTRAWIVAATAGVLMGTTWSSSAQDPSTTDKIKSKASDVVTSIKKGAASAGGAIKEKFAKTKDYVVGMGIEGRVYARLHWDRALVGSKIDLSAPKSGVIALTGTVTDEKAKLKAVELTRDTVGVTEVQDHLTISPAAVISPGGSTSVKP
jgi:osmotically-inducible protein OsmY